MNRLAPVVGLLVGALWAPNVRAGACWRYAARAVAAGRNPAALAELSGLAASRRHPGVYWAHNDSGNAFELFAIADTGRIVARFRLLGATPKDVEDVAVGPCDPGVAASCVFLADSGDNLRRKSRYRLYRLPEPDRLDGGPRRVTVLEFAYPDGAHDAEALVVEPRSGRVFVVTKRLASLGTVYRLDGLGVGRRGSAVAVGTITAPGLSGLTTAADLHPDGDRLLLRTYFGVFELARPGVTDVTRLVAEPPVPVTDGDQSQPEAVAYRADGRGYLLGSEKAGAPLFRVDCDR